MIRAAVECVAYLILLAAQCAVWVLFGLACYKFVTGGVPL